MAVERASQITLSSLLMALLLFLLSAGSGRYLAELMHSDTPTATPVPVTPMVSKTASAHPVFGTLQWQGGSEAEAAAFMATLKTLAMLHFEKEHQYLQQDIEPLIAPVWRDYPTLVSASACVYCGDISGAVLHLMRTQPLPDRWVEEVGRGIPRYLPLLRDSGVLSGDELYRLARIHAQLGSAGDADLAQAVAAPLIRQHDMRHLAMWVSKGLNGGKAVTDSEALEKLPEEIVIQAWRNGVAMGYDTPELSEFLLQRGYRPALRWLVWVQDGSADYLVNKYTHYQLYAQRYEQMLKTFSDFPVTQGPELGTFYSQHWREIHWDSYSRRWRTSSL